MKKPYFLHVDTNLLKLKKLIEKYYHGRGHKWVANSGCRNLKLGVFHKDINRINCILVFRDKFRKA